MINKIKNNIFNSIGNLKPNINKKEIFIKILDIEIYNWLLENTSFLNKLNPSISQRLYHILNNLNNIPKCPTCGNIPNFNSFNNGYFVYCSKKCVSNNINIKNKKEKTSLKKWGTKNPASSNYIKQKIKEKFVEKYNVEHPMKNKKFLENYKKNNIENLGVNFPFQSDLIQSKCKETMKKKYGEYNPSNVKNINEKRILNNIKKWNSRSSLGSPINIKKARKTKQVKYGNEFYSNRKKAIKTCIKRYNVDHYAKTEEYKIKYKKTSIKRYNVDHYAKTKEYKIKLNKRYFLNKLNNIDILKIKPLFTEEDFIFNGGYKFLCLKCKNTFFSKINNIRCKNCYPIEIKKSQQRDVYYFITNNIDCEHHYNYREYDNNVENNHSFTEIDIYLPEYKLGIEYNGVYWHSESNGGKDKNYHLNKTELCEDKNINLIHIFENEWMNKQEIVKSIILSKLGIFKERIYARKCIVKEIDNKSKNDFLNKNHIQGQDISKYKLGLFYNDELVSVMTFGQRNITGKSSFELIRFCSKLNTQIIGGASKLFQYFIKNYWNNQQIISYADRRWSNGNLYNNLGFKFSHNSPPNYWYIIDDKLVHRVNYQKHKLKDKLEYFDTELTEWENMQMNGFDRIWDCGNMVFKYN